MRRHINLSPNVGAGKSDLRSRDKSSILNDAVLPGLLCTARLTDSIVAVKAKKGLHWRMSNRVNVTLELRVLDGHWP